jgi:hypothetical protein
MSRKKPYIEPTNTASWQFTPEVKKALVREMMSNGKGGKARCIERTEAGPRVKFNGIRIGHTNRRIEMLFDERVVADFPMPSEYAPGDNFDLTILLNEGDGGHLAVKLV